MSLGLHAHRARRAITVLGTVSVVLGVLLLVGFVIDGRTLFGPDAGPVWAGIGLGAVVLSLRRAVPWEGR